jgi:uncharacterized membrane protein YdjX (TVP38/TMEM64 family)
MGATGAMSASATAGPLARLAAFALVLGALCAAGFLFAPHSAKHLRHDLEGLGVWVPVAMVIVYAVATCAFVPGAVLAGASGLLLGTLLGTAVAVISATLGASAAFLIARILARGPYRAVAGERLRALTARIERRGFVALFYARLTPGAPFALVSYAAGMTRIRWRDFAAATAIVASPRAFAYASLGGHLGNYSSPQALAAIGVLVLMTMIGMAVLWRGRPRWRQAQPKEVSGLREPPAPRGD